MSLKNIPQRGIGLWPKLFLKNRQIIMAPSHDLVAQSARDLIAQWATKLTVPPWKNRASPT